LTRVTLTAQRRKRGAGPLLSQREREERARALISLSHDVGEKGPKQCICIAWEVRAGDA
jgi:hypothetical protein